MGRKDTDQEVEKFLSANTQELGKDKWLCPLSGKKFKGPEFVRKHILNKHGDKIEEKPRPRLPPPLGQVCMLLDFRTLISHHRDFWDLDSPAPVLGFGGGPPYPPNQFGGGRGNFDNFRGHGGYPGKPRNNRMFRGDPRNIIEYRDLDAPEDVDFF
ncbi:hypothetical protein ANANG_G00057780 [Anguilla anguilla]|uniref:SERRATE/Ars2 C-terminal domain-containing protein n=1 Tax=Anguilla anguilla TaxID=7936 RepID=A0A9D3S298_ANGAN|nr:hypothetical protein ANANG_G00057780 [Anguilla anguilla]